MATKGTGIVNKNEAGGTGITSINSDTAAAQTISGEASRIIITDASPDHTITIGAAIVATDRANVFGDFNQDFKDNRIRIFNPADTFPYTIIAATIAAARNVTLPLLTGNDIFVTEAFAQTLTNKTIDANNNTILNITNSELSTGVFAAITGLGVQTQPLDMDGNDIILDAAGNIRIHSSVANVTKLKHSTNFPNFALLRDQLVADGSTAGKISFRSKDDVPNERVFGEIRVIIEDTTVVGNLVHGSLHIRVMDANVETTYISFNDAKSGQIDILKPTLFADVDVTIKDNRLKILNPADTFAYTIIGSAIAGAINVTLPLLTSNDTFVTEAFAQTLTNKTIDSSNNTITNIVNADISATALIAVSKLENGTDSFFVRGTGSAGCVLEAIEISKGGTVLDPDVRNIIVWRAPFACTVTNVRAYVVGGASSTINARKNGSLDHLSANLTVTPVDTWVDGGAVQNTAYAAGDKLEIKLVTIVNAPTQLAIQVDFTRP